MPRFEASTKGGRGPWTRALELILGRTLADSGWLVLTIVVGMAVRTVVIVAGSGGRWRSSGAS